MKKIIFVLLLVVFQIGCDSNDGSNVNIHHNKPFSYYVGNTQYGYWDILPSGQEVWVMYPRYSQYGPSSLDTILAAGLTHMYYRSVWNSSYPNGWGTSGQYDTKRASTINKTIINNYGGVDGLKKKAKSPEFKEKHKKRIKLVKVKASNNFVKSSNKKTTSNKDSTSKKSNTSNKTVKSSKNSKSTKLYFKSSSKKSYSYTPPKRKSSYTSKYKSYKSSYKKSSYKRK